MHVAAPLAAGTQTRCRQSLRETLLSCGRHGEVTPPSREEDELRVEANVSMFTANGLFMIVTDFFQAEGYQRFAVMLRLGSKKPTVSQTDELNTLLSRNLCFLLPVRWRNSLHSRKKRPPACSKMFRLRRFGPESLIGTTS